MQSFVAICARVLPGILLAVLVTFLASCGGGIGSSTPPVTTTVSASGPTAQVAYLATADVTWTSSDSTTCSSSPSGIAGTSGTYTTPPLSVTTTYTITCVGPSGAASARVTID